MALLMMSVCHCGTIVNADLLFPCKFISGAPPPLKLKRSGNLTVLKTRIREGVSGKIHTLTVQTPLGLLYGVLTFEQAILICTKWGGGYKSTME